MAVLLKSQKMIEPEAMTGRPNGFEREKGRQFAPPKFLRGRVIA